jgi:HSP20 family protein
MTLIKKSNLMFPSVFNDFFDSENFFRGDLLDTRFFRNSLPAVNIIENEKNFMIEVAAPGFRKKDFHIDVEDKVLMIKGEKIEENKEKEENYTKREFSYSSFQRSFTLPEFVLPDKIEGKYEDGILRIMLPKMEEARKKNRKEIAVS